MTDDKRAARDRFGWIQRVARDRELHPNARLLGIIISDFINRQTGIAFPSQQTLAEILRDENLDETARQSVLRILVAISRRQRNGGAS